MNWNWDPPCGRRVWPDAMPVLYLHSTLKLHLGVDRVDLDTGGPCRVGELLVMAGLDPGPPTPRGSNWLILLDGRNINLLAGFDTPAEPASRIDILPPACGG